MKVEGSVIVGRPSWEVFTYLSEPRLGAAWVAGVMEVRLVTGSTAGGGDHAVE